MTLDGSRPTDPGLESLGYARITTNPTPSQPRTLHLEPNQEPRTQHRLPGPEGLGDDATTRTENGCRDADDQAGRGAYLNLLGQASGSGFHDSTSIRTSFMNGSRRGSS